MNEKEIEMTFTLIEAKGGKSAKVLGLAYSGGAIDLGWDAPVVVDLAGMQIAETIPLLAAPATVVEPPADDAIEEEDDE